jgi:ATP adenylyltransferase
MENMATSGQGPILMQPGTLWSRIQEQTELARETGALNPISTEVVSIEDRGIRFMVRVAPGLKGKTLSRRRQRRFARNPFLPYDPDLFAGHLSATHLCLLNRFCVLEHHALIVTRAFQDQDSPLDRRDFEALCLCLGEIDGLAFFNSGPEAGASQAHKHLQLVPLPLGPGPERIPLEPVFKAAIAPSSADRGVDLPFLHQASAVDTGLWSRPRLAAEELLAEYLKLLGTLKPGQSHIPHNLLVTREWMLVVPRHRESFGPVSVNALGFAGGLLVRSHDELDWVARQGPLTILRNVGVPYPDR